MKFCSTIKVNQWWHDILPRWRISYGMIFYNECQYSNGMISYKNFEAAISHNVSESVVTWYPTMILNQQWHDILPWLWISDGIISYNDCESVMTLYPTTNVNQWWHDNLQWLWIRDILISYNDCEQRWHDILQYLSISDDMISYNYYEQWWNDILQW